MKTPGRTRPQTSGKGIAIRTRITTTAIVWLAAISFTAFQWDIEEGPVELTDRFLIILVIPAIAFHWIFDSLGAFDGRLLFLFGCFGLTAISLCCRRLLLLVPVQAILFWLIVHSLFLEMPILNAAAHGSA